jgi:hypothetical protein
MIETLFEGTADIVFGGLDCANQSVQVPAQFDLVFDKKVHN